mgnify:CR=1 FL=1
MVPPRSFKPTTPSVYLKNGVPDGELLTTIEEWDAAYGCSSASGSSSEDDDDDDDDDKEARRRASVKQKSRRSSRSTSTSTSTSISSPRPSSRRPSLKLRRASANAKQRWSSQPPETPGEPTFRRLSSDMRLSATQTAAAASAKRFSHSAPPPVPPPATQSTQLKVKEIATELANAASQQPTVRRPSLEDLRKNKNRTSISVKQAIQRFSHSVAAPPPPGRKPQKKRLTRRKKKNKKAQTNPRSSTQNIAEQVRNRYNILGNTTL